MADPALNPTSPTTARWLLCLRSAGLRFAIAVERVARASYLVAAQPVPGSPDYLVGLTALDGESVPMVDLAQRLGLETDTAYALSTPMVWCHGVDRVVALVVDEVDGVFAGTDVSGRVDADLQVGRAPLTGVAQCSGESWLVLDCDRLLALDFSQRGSPYTLDSAALQRLLDSVETRYGEDHG